MTSPKKNKISEVFNVELYSAEAISTFSSLSRTLYAVILLVSLRILL
jgi:hypothetical protein